MNENLTKILGTISSYKNKVNAKLISYIGLLGVLLVAIFVRTRNLGYLSQKYLIELDSSMFYRYANYIVENGTLFAKDMLRYIPEGYVLSSSDKFFSYSLAYGYKLISWTGITQIHFHVLYPVIATAISLIFFFLFVREISDNLTAVVATAFLAVIPAYIYRTGAGFADHEAMAMLWMFISLWLFAKAWVDSSKGSAIWKTTLLSIASGVFCGFMILTWGGYSVLLAVIGLFIPLALLFAKINKRQIIAFWAWLVPTGIFLYIREPNIKVFASHYDFLILLFGAVSCGIYILSEIFADKIPKKLTEYLPTKLLVLLSSIIISIIGAFTAGVDLGSIISSVFFHQPSSRLGATISENAQPYFTGGNSWMGSLGWTTWLFLASAVLLVYLMFRGNKKYSIPIVLGWAITLAATIFGNYKPGSYINEIFSGVYIYFIIGFILLTLVIYLYTYMKDNAAFNQLFNTSWQNLMIFGWFFFTLIITKRSVRVMMLLAPIAAVVIAYCLVKVFLYLWKGNHKVTAGIICALVLVCFILNAQTSLAINSGMGSSYPGPWKNAMEWVKTNTSEDAVFMHWWDYGYWLQTEGKRATVVDGGNAKGWDHDAGRYGLLGKDPAEYLSYLKTHKVTHLLISSEEIGKFHAFATIGSDENWDLRSTIGLFSMKEQQEMRNATRLIYSGWWTLDQDYTFGNKVFKSGSDAITGFSIDLVAGGGLVNPQVLLFDGESGYTQPLQCICQGGECKNITSEGMNGCMTLVPFFTSQTEGNQIGAAFFTSEKIVDTNLVQMYIFEKENPYFKLVYSNDMPLALYNGYIVGPIEIWEVQYPDWVKEDPKYLEHSIYG